jgi:Right handed beta helix region
MKARLTIAIAFVVLLAAGAHAQATRTWVSGVGDDVNPCSRTAPCKTFAGAISKTAAGGEINTLDPGGFGAVTITKSITIDGGPWAGGILASGTSGVIVNALSTDRVVLRRLTMNGHNFTAGSGGVRILAAGQVIIEDCEIYQFERGIRFASSTANSFLKILRTTVRNNSSIGISVEPTSTGTRVDMDDVQVFRNTADGIFLSNNVTANLRNVSSFGNAGNQGLNVLENSGSTTDVTVDGCSFTNNANGIFVSGTGGALIRVGRTTISQNTSNGLNIGAGTHAVESFGNNQLRGNPNGNSFSSTPGQN